MDKLIQLIGIILLYLIGLSGSKDVYSKKRALTKNWAVSNEMQD